MFKQNRVAAAFLVAFSAGAVAGGETSGDRLRNLEQRVQSLETADATDGMHGVRFSGLVEVEAAAGEDHEGSDSSDVVVATVELAAEARINEWTGAEVVYLFEEDDTEPGEIDQAILTLGNPEASPLLFAAGRMYVPFGGFESGMLSDPMTLELGETRESALRLGLASNGLYGSAFLFNGDSQEAGDDDKVEHCGASLGFAGEGFDVGVGYISSLADSDGDWSAVPDLEAMQEKVAGITAHAVVNAGAFTVIGEYLGATGRFDQADPPSTAVAPDPLPGTWRWGTASSGWGGRPASAPPGRRAVRR